MSLMSLTAAELGRKIKSGEVTAVQAAQKHDAIAAKETAVNSFVTVVDKDKVLAQAENVQKQIEAGEYTGVHSGCTVTKLKIIYVHRGIL